MKTKLFLIVVIALISVVFLSSCGRSRSGKRVKEISNTTVNTKIIRLSQEKYDSLVYKAQQASYLKEDMESLEKHISNLEKNPQFFLLVLDAELSATEKKEDPYGSFSDYFIPTIYKALEAGISRVEIQKRVNRLIQLANRGLFISSYEKKLFDEGGTKAIVEAIGLDQ